MNMIRYQPWNLVDQLFNGHSFGFNGELNTVSAWTPRVDVKEEAERFLIRADIPGVDPKDIEVSLENGLLTISGERKTESRDEQEGWTRVERHSGRFQRSFTLPETVDAEGVSAKGSHGVLEISIPKVAKVQPRKIEVKVN
ncbi:MAG TPA: Hsp20/alpha crystallin family protein [Gammaproteobacteria bacterium]|nr:Hsp20/alpha crystallin family protein [Gammaproteobacteria bacterium]